MKDIEFNILPSPGLIDITVNDNVCISKEWKQFRFPKTKKVRIQNKWSKRKANFRFTDIHKAFKIGNRMIVSSLIYKKLKGETKPVTPDRKDCMECCHFAQGKTCSFCANEKQTNESYKSYTYWSFSCELWEKGIHQTRIDYMNSLKK